MPRDFTQEQPPRLTLTLGPNLFGGWVAAPVGYDISGHGQTPANALRNLADGMEACSYVLPTLAEVYDPAE